ncbi:MAG: hypothetical protein WC966_08185 [Bradymonadales bacterium]|jgi:hypothetical protein
MKRRAISSISNYRSLAELLLKYKSKFALKAYKEKPLMAKLAGLKEENKTKMLR